MKKGIWAALATLVGVALIAAAVPLIASTQIVRDRIAYEMSAWSGFRVSLGAVPRIEVWPSFRAVLSEVTLSEWASEENPPVVRAERIEIDLAALPALQGKIRFSKVRLIRPTFRISTWPSTFVGPTLPSGGRIGRAITAARATVSANPTTPDVAALPSGSFGTVEFNEGRVEFHIPGEGPEVVTSVAGSISWPEFNKTGALSATGIWRGESVALEASSQQPLVLLAGGNAPLTFDFKADPLNASFNGVANISDVHFVDGSVKLSSPSLGRALEWSRTEIAPGAAIGAVSLDAKVMGSGQRFKFGDTRLVLEGNPGTGVLDLSFAESVPGVSGTLAFDKLDLQSFMSAFAMFPWGRAADDIDVSFIDQLRLDLRVSAATATAGPITLAEVAATAQVKGGLAAFDISDASAFSGAIQASFRLDRQLEGTQAEIRMLASDIDSAALASAAGLTRLVPHGRGTISVILKGIASDWNSMFAKADGTLSAKLGAGKISGIDLSAFLKRSSQGGFFALSEVEQGSLAIEGAELKASVSNGIARIEKADVKAGPRLISISGIVPYVGRGLALSGTVTPGATDKPDDPGTAFFVGGPWAAPFVSPIIAGPPREW